VDLADTSLHESVHAVAALALGRRVRWARVAVRPVPGRDDIVEEGAVSFDRDGVIDRRDIIAVLAPGLFEGSRVAWDSGSSVFGVWPPLYETLGLDAEGDRGEVSKIVRLLGLSAKEYDDVIREARELLAKPELQLWIAKVAAALAREGHLTGAEVEALRPDRLTVELQEAA